MARKANIVLFKKILNLYSNSRYNNNYYYNMQLVDRNKLTSSFTKKCVLTHFNCMTVF